MCKKIICAVLMALTLTGCFSEKLDTKEKINEIYQIQVEELEKKIPLKKELGESKYNELIDFSAMGIRVLYDFPENISWEQRVAMIEANYMEEMKEQAIQRASDISKSYTTCRLTLKNVTAASAGVFHERNAYKILFNGDITTDKGKESVVFEVITMVQGDGLKIYFASPTK